MINELPGWNWSEWWQSTVGAFMGNPWECTLVVRPLRLKGIKRVFMSRSLRVQPQAIMGSGLVE
jgi:hypothetical protein